MSIVDLKRGITLAQLAVADYVEGIDYDDELDRYYVASWFDNMLIVIDGKTEQIIARIPCEDGTRAFGKFILR